MGINYQEKKEGIETLVTLTPSFGLESDVTQKVDEWLQNEVRNKGIGWIHIYKYLDELHIYGEGYNTPPLTKLIFDIEILDPEIAEGLGNTVYKHLQRRGHLTGESEYLQYLSVNKYIKEQNQGKEKMRELLSQFETDGSIIDSYETYLYQGNTFYNMLSSLYENGNCRVYTDARNTKQIIYNFYVDEKGRLRATSSYDSYDKAPWKNQVDGLGELEMPSERGDEQEVDVKLAIADLVIKSNYNVERVVTTHRPIKKTNTLFATNEAFSYIYNMYSVFKNETTENWLEENNLLARWVKGGFNGKINLLASVTPDFNPGMNFRNKSYYEMMSQMFLAIDNFNQKVIPVQREWQKIKNGEYDDPSKNSGSAKR